MNVFADVKGRAAISITIHDVAQRAGVSAKTVSRAMNNHPGVSQATRTAVLQAIQELNFRPNAAARGLRKGRTGIIGVFVPDLRNTHYVEYACHLQDIANTAGYMLVVTNTNYNQDLSLVHLRTLIDHRADAVIWLSGPLEQKLLRLVREATLPMVIVDTIPPEGIDHVRALQTHPARDRTTYEITSRLIALGHRCLAYITEGGTQISEYGRVNAFRQAIHDHGLPPEASLVKSGQTVHGSRIEDGYEVMNALLATGERPTAVCTLTDLLAIGVLRSLHEHGLRVPDDVSVVGCDDITQSSYTDPPLSTIHTPYAEVSALMLDLTRHLIEPDLPYDPTRAATITYPFVERASVGPAPPVASFPGGPQARL